tara:strand:- start:199 stop:435 length:237 start_codon:yes stop_codon:yes gene_type:complete
MEFNYIKAARYKYIFIQADIFINLASIQEMTYKVINMYFETNSDRLFYLCKQLFKELLSVEITKFYKYPRLKDDEMIF